MEILRARKGFSERYVVEEIAGAAANGPSYPLGLAVRDDAAEWARLLIAAQKNELHANADVPTAWLYAIYRGERRSQSPPGARGRRGTSPRRARDFERSWRRTSRTRWNGASMGRMRHRWH